MPTVMLPNGKFADFPDDTPDSVIASVKAQNAPTRVQAKAAGVPRTATKSKGDELPEIGSWAHDAISSIPVVGKALNSFHRAVDKGLTFNTADEIAGGASALTGGDYTKTRDLERAKDAQAAQDAPATSLVGEIGGALANPIGTGGRVARAAAKLLPGGRVAAALASPVGRAVVAGGEQGALNAAGSAEELKDVPGAALHGGEVGGLVGGAFGGLASGASKIRDIYKLRQPAGAENAAYARVAAMLDNAGKTPAQVQREIGVTDARGGDAIVGEMTHPTRNMMAALSRKPDLPSANNMVQQGIDRNAARPDLFREQVTGTSGITQDAANLGERITAGRKAQGQADYGEGGIMDKPIQWTDELDDFFAHAPKETNQALKSAYDNMLLRREKPGDHFGTETLNKGTPAEETRINFIPNLRSLDYAKRGFDEEIGNAIKAGKTTVAQGLSSELSRLKDLVIKANPDYADVLATQRDAFQKVKALEIGQDALKRVTSIGGARDVLKEIKSQVPQQQMEARIGIIDALVNNTKADPVQYYNSITRSQHQKDLLEFAFGGKQQLNRFNRWVRREGRAQLTDDVTRSGKQSITGNVNLANDSLIGDESGNALWQAFKGYGYGGPVGAIAGASRAIQNISTGSNAAVQEQIAKILMSKGQGLQKGISTAEKYMKSRKALRIERAVRAAKAAQQTVTGLIGE